MKPCLNMIVKNEVRNLERCLASVAPYIGCWVIGDTGSTDGTQDYIRAFFAERGIAGELHEYPFVDFSQARNEALSRARRSSLQFDWLLLTDADMELVVGGAGFPADLRHDLYQCVQTSSGLAYWNVRLVRRSCNATYRGVTHEFIGGDDLTQAPLDGVSFLDHATGSNRPEKSERDTRLLTDALRSEPDPRMRSRYTFYLANTLREAGKLEDALTLYIQRSEQGGWQEEAFMSLFHAGSIRASLGHPPEQVLADFEAATRQAPWRAEALHAAASYCRQRRDHEKAHAFATRGLQLAYPTNSLFVLSWVYDYGLLDELAVSSYWVGNYDESLALCERLLRENLIPAEYRPRIERNADYARQRLRERTPPRANAQPAPQSTTPGGQALQSASAATHSSPSGAGSGSELSALLLAFEQAPDDARALLSLSQHCRRRDLHNAAVMFAERGLRCQPPPGRHDAGDHEATCLLLKQELSISGYYAQSPAEREKGFAACNELSLSRSAPPDVRALARKNLRFYACRAGALFASIKLHQQTIAVPEGYNPLNPSVAVFDDALVMNIRCVNYRLRDGMYEMAGGDKAIRTWNALVRLNDKLETVSCHELAAPRDMPEPAFPPVRGFEDIRLIPHDGSLWSSATVRELNREGLCEIVLSRIQCEPDGKCQLADWRALHPEGERRHEKNWTPMLDGGELRFIYTYDPAVIISATGKQLGSRIPDLAAEHFRGGSQAIPFDGGFLSVIHEVIVSGRERTYLHRFVKTDGDGKLLACTRPFNFFGRQIEFVSGLARPPGGNRLLVSFGVDDCEAWIAEINEDDVRRAL